MTVFFFIQESRAVMRHVETLTVSRTNLAIVAVNDFDLFPNLRTLNLHQNKLARIAKNSFRVLNQLTSLDLSNNNIMHLSRDHLVGLQACQTLNLSRNYLGSVIADQVWPVMQLFCVLFTVTGLCQLLLTVFSDLQVLSGTSDNDLMSVKFRKQPKR